MELRNALVAACRWLHESFAELLGPIGGTGATAEEILLRLGAEVRGRYALSEEDRNRLLRAVAVIRFPAARLSGEPRVVSELCERLKQRSTAELGRDEALIRFLNRASLPGDERYLQTFAGIF